MIGLKKRDIKKALRAGAKAGGVSLADVGLISKRRLTSCYETTMTGKCRC